MGASLGIAEHAAKVRVIFLIMRWFLEVLEPVSIQCVSVPWHVLEVLLLPSTREECHAGFWYSIGRETIEFIVQIIIRLKMLK